MFFCTTVIFPYEMHTSSMLRALHFFMYTSLHLDSEIRYTRIMFYFFNPPIDYIFFRWIAFLRIDRCHLQLIHFTLSISIDSINELKAISDMMKLIVDGNVAATVSVAVAVIMIIIEYTTLAAPVFFHLYRCVKPRSIEFHIFLQMFAW